MSLNNNIAEIQTRKPITVSFEGLLLFDTVFMDTGIKLKPKSCSITRKRGSFAGFKTYCHMSIGAKTACIVDVANTDDADSGDYITYL